MHCADRSVCEQPTVGKSKYCRTHRAESRARFKENVTRWKAEAEAKRTQTQAQRDEARRAELLAELAGLGVSA